MSSLDTIQFKILMGTMTFFVNVPTLFEFEGQNLRIHLDYKCET